MSSVRELLDLKQIKSLQTTSFARWWNKNYSSQIERLEEHEEWFDSLIDDAVVDAIASETVTDYSIPDDEHEGWVTSVGDAELESIEWEKCESIGSGILVVPMQFTVDIEIAFQIYRGDAYDPPDWVNVSYGDPEYDHYFPASGSRRAFFTAQMVIGYEQSLMEARDELSHPNIEIEEAVFQEFVD